MRDVNMLRERSVSRLVLLRKLDANIDVKVAMLRNELFVSDHLKCTLGSIGSVRGVEFASEVVLPVNSVS